MDQAIIDQMRDWVIDCAVNDEDQDLRESASDQEIVNWVKAQYHGGIAAFVDDCN